MWMGGENGGITNLVVANNGVEENNVNLVDGNVVVGGGLTSFKSMTEAENEWYTNITNEAQDTIVFNPPNFDSSSSCSPSPSVYTPSNFDPSQIPYLFPQRNNIFGNPLPQSFNLGGNNNGFLQEIQTNNSHHQIADLMKKGSNNGGVLGAGFNDFSPQNEINNLSFGANSQFPAAHLFNLDGADAGFGVASGSRFRAFDENLMNSSLFMNRDSKLLKPLDNSAPAGAQPTLFQKRAALRKNFGSTSGMISSAGQEYNEKLVNSAGENEKKRKFSNVDGLDSVSFDGPAGFNYDSDDFVDNATTQNISTGNMKAAKNGGGNSNANSTVTGNGNGETKGKKKGLPAKNLMAERRRRKKLNDRLYMLRSVVPKISKMDRASILGDAIEYLKELLQRINDLHNELEACPPASSLTQATNIHPLTPTLPNLPSRIKEELCPSSLPGPNGQPARIEVRLREGRAVNIHMFCGRRPGLLLSTMRALDGLGLDIQQAVISCFNGFAMDIFRAEQCKEGQAVYPEQIEAQLLELATFHGSSVVGNCNM